MGGTLFLWTVYRFLHFLWPFVALTVAGVALWTLYQRLRLKRPSGCAEDVVFTRRWLLAVTTLVLVVFLPVPLAGSIERALPNIDDSDSIAP